MSLADQLAQGIQFAAPPDPFAQYGKMQQLQQGQQQMQISQMQLDELKRDREGMMQFQKDLAAKGGNPDPLEYAKMMMKSSNAAQQKMGVELYQKILGQRQFASIFADEAPATPTAPAAAPTAKPMALPAAAPENALGSGTFGMGPTVAPTNALAPAPAAPVNALVDQPNATKIAQTQNQIKKLMQFAASNPEMSTQAMAQARILQDQLELYSRRDQPDRLLTPAQEEQRIRMAIAGRAPPVDRLLTPEEEEQRIRVALASRAPRPEAAPRTQQVKMDDGTIGIMNMDTGAVTPATLGGAPVKGQDALKTAVSEQQAAYNIGRLLTAANQIKDITGKDPSSMKPGATEAFASSVGMGGTANLARPANRQIVQGAQRDALDALLYLATGAAYNKEQLLGQMEAYIPAFTDAKETVVAKQTRMADLIQSAKARAGKAWTPQMDAAMKT
jgi:hypothetical protein